MRKIVLFMSISADGYMAGLDGDLGWHRVDEEVHQHFNEVLSEMSVFLDGRVTYELMVDFWPTADEDPDAPAPVAEFARIWRETPKVVFSRTLESADWNTRIVREVDPAQIRAWCAEPGGDMVVGGADLAATFLAEGLIDEFRLYVHPVLVGRGKRLFREADSMQDLELLSSRVFGNGVVLLHYARTTGDG
jgi:dihydrofolate reductase